MSQPDPDAAGIQAARAGYLIQIGNAVVLTGYVYHFILTMDVEIAVVWPSNWTFGRFLYFFNRYGNLLYFTMVTVYANTFYFSVPLEVCVRLRIVNLVLMAITRHSIELSITLCTYALLGATRRWLIIAVTLYLGFTVPGTVTSIMFESSRQGRLPGPLYRSMGFMCTYTDPTRMEYLRPSLYISVAGTVVSFTVGLCTLWFGYRHHRSRTINAIRREGGLCYFLILVGRIVALGTTDGIVPNSEVTRVFQMLITISLFLLAPIFATRMLLMIRQAQDQKVRSVVSTLIFTPVAFQRYPAYDDDGESSSPDTLFSPGKSDVEMTMTRPREGEVLKTVSQTESKSHLDSFNSEVRHVRSDSRE